MPRILRRDEGNTHVLEAVIIASIMLSAVAFVATFENPVSGSTPTRELLSAKATDAIQILIDTPVKNSTFGDNLLSVLLAHCMQGNCTALTAKLDRLLPLGTSYALYVSNGYETYPVYVTRSPSGEAVTSTALLEPHWSYTFTGTGLSVVNNDTDPMLTYALPVYNSNVISPGGSPLKIIVKGTKQSDGSSYTLEGFYTTLAVDNASAGQHPAVSLNFLVNKTGLKSYDDLGSFFPGAYWDRYAEVVNAEGHPNNKSVTFSLQLNESAGVPIPQGTELAVNIPRGWNASGWNDTNWQVIQNAYDRNASYNGSDVIARLLRPVSSESVEFKFNATYHGDLLRYYPFRASLTRGVSAEANLLVEADRWPENTQTFAIPRVVASVPRPMGATAETTWSLAVNIPYNPAGGFVVSKGTIMKPEIPETQPTTIVSGLGRTTKGIDTRDPYIDYREPGDAATEQNSNIIIKSITILEQDGKRIFGGVTPGRVGEGHGTWTSRGDRLEWSGSHNATTQGTLNLTFNVTGMGGVGGAAPKMKITPPVQYSTFTGRLLSQTAPGFFRDAILPNGTTAAYYETTGNRYRGYDPGTSNLQALLNHEFTSNSLYRSTYLNGTGNYSIHPASPFTDALYGSYVAVEKRNVPVGGQVVLTADVQSMLYALSAAGQSAGVNLTFYPPWSGDSKVPIWSQANLDSAFLASGAVQLMMMDVTDDGFPDPIVGTDQGRVLAFDGLTGQRVQGSTWVAPVLGDQSGVAVIKHLVGITLGGQDYVVVATDGKSGVYILRKDFSTAWSWSKTADTITQATTALDATADIDGDGRRDLVVALEGGATYVLRALAGGDQLAMLAPATPPPAPQGAFNKTQGTPATILGLTSTGHAGTPGVAVSLVSLPGADLNLRLDKDHPEQLSANPQLVAKTPRAGLTVFDNAGRTDWTYLSTPVSVLRPYDWNSDGREELLVGSSSGHVVMLNGQRGAGPMTSLIWTPVVEIVDADARDLAHSVWLTRDGTIAFSYDGWSTHNCVSCDPVANALGLSYPTMKGIALNSTMGIWAAGENSWLLRATPGLAPGYPWMSVVIPNATKNGVDYNYNLSLHTFNDITFDWGPQGDHGFVVGDPLLPALCLPGIVAASLLGHCDEGLLMETLDGGATWRIKSELDDTMIGKGGAATKVTAGLTRVNFTTDSVGWVVGKAGTLLRTTDSGATWQQLDVPTTVNLRDVSCAQANPDYCIVVGEGGVALRSTDARTTATWTNISANLGIPVMTLKSTGVVNSEKAYIGYDNGTILTLDGGASWTELPIGYVPGTPNRMSVFPDGSGFLWGGNATAARQWHLHDFARSATVRTTDVTTTNALPATAKVHHASAWAAFTPATGTAAKVYLSADGGATWSLATKVMEGQTSSTENSVPVALARDKFMVDLTPGDPAACGSTCGKDVRVRVDMETTPDVSMMSIFLADLQVEVTYRDTATGLDTNRTFTVDIPAATMKDPATTAVWNADIGAIHLPLVQAKFWATNVSGSVLDVQTGWDLPGTSDTRKEVWVSTGDVLAENSPDYMVYAGTNASRVIKPDNRIYLLDGKTGKVIASTAELEGEVTNIRLADEDANGVPDWLYASVWDVNNGGSTSRAYIRAFDPVTLAVKPIVGDPDGWVHDVFPYGTRINDIEVGRNATNSTVFGARGTTVSFGANTNKVVSGGVSAIVGHGRHILWKSQTDERGQYLVTKDIPMNWFFGPYVVEVKVDWQDTVQVIEGGVPVERELLQSAQFYDYFMVTPPDALNPPSPVYTVHLVTWMDDWR